MKVILHSENRVIGILDDDLQRIDDQYSEHPVVALFELSKTFPDELIVWCKKPYLSSLNHGQLNAIFHHKRILASYTVSQQQFIPKEIGYVESTPFININYNVTYPTWMMSSDVGGIHAAVINSLKVHSYRNRNFDFTLNSIAKSCMRAGLFCYSEPNLLKDIPPNVEETTQLNTKGLFRFVAQHFKRRWTLILLAAYVFYEKRYLVFTCLNTLLVKRIKVNPVTISEIDIRSSKVIEVENTYDIVIPTIGRKKFLFDFLKDIANQTLPPENVIIVEQNPDEGSISELDFINSNDWPFQIVHQFTHRTGACHARNLAFQYVKSDWVVLADDDCRIASDVYEKTLQYLRKYGAKAITASVLQPHEKQTYIETEQTTIFGSGSSMIMASLVKETKFDLGYEFGYGEDIDYGMQLRNRGVDIIYCPYLHITHLKAPMGGFRTSFELPWQNEEIKPLPSPTVMLYNIKHRTRNQIYGYKLLYFLRTFLRKPFRNPFLFVKKMNVHWQQSVDWANKLKKD